MNSLLKNEVIDAISTPLRKAVTVQRSRAAEHPDKSRRLVSARVPQWYYDALKTVQGSEPKVFGQPVMVGPHEDIVIV